MKKQIFFTIGTLFVLAIALAACAGSPASTPTAWPTPDPSQVSAAQFPPRSPNFQVKPGESATDGHFRWTIYSEGLIVWSTLGEDGTWIPMHQRPQQPFGPFVIPQGKRVSVGGVKWASFQLNADDSVSIELDGPTSETWCKTLTGMDYLNAAADGSCKCPDQVANWGGSMAPSGVCKNAYDTRGNLKPVKK